MSGYNNRSQPQKDPAPFFWIDLEKSPNRNALISHDSFTGLTGRLELEIEVFSDYLYVGSGAILLDEKTNRAYYAFARRDGQLIIPSTGIKGPIRSIVEAISNSCVSSRLKRKESVSNDKHSACEIKRGQEENARLCPACRLFGATGYRGRVHFGDAQLVKPTQPKIIKISDLWPPRQDKGRKFYHTKAFQPQDDRPERNHRFLEAMPKGTLFSATLFFENTTPVEMSLLIRAMGIDIHSQKPDTPAYVFPIKLGGAKPRCLGAAYFRLKQIRLVAPSNSNLFHSLAEGGERQPLKETLVQWLQDDSLLDKKAWEVFKQKAKPLNSESCPQEMY